MMMSLTQFFSGIAALGAWIGAVYFFKFWLKTRDRLFWMFSVSFCLMALERFVLVLQTSAIQEEYSYVYLIRLIAFIIIIVAVIDKNRTTT